MKTAQTSSCVHLETRVASVPGSTLVPSVGEGVPPSRTSDDARFSQSVAVDSLAQRSPSRRDASTNARDERATRSSRPRASFAICIAVACLPTAARACTVCMGDSNSNIAGAANGAIFLMIGAIGTMLAALSGFGFYLYKRASAPIPPHIPLVEEMSGEEGDQPHA